MRLLKPEELNENVFNAIGREWMLITAGRPEHFNTMTASWGGLGFLWNKPVAFVFIRPERYTYDFMEAEDSVTLTFLGQTHRDIYSLCGKLSGRDTDKVAATGLRPSTTPQGAVSFEQARLTLGCRKLYSDDLRQERFIDPDCFGKWYHDRPGGGLHRMYILEITEVLLKD